MDAPLFTGRQQSVAGGLDILRDAAGQTADDGPLHLGGDRVDSLKVPVADHGEPRLEDIHFESGELAGYLQLLTQVHGGTGTLFAVAQGRVKDEDSVVFHGKGSGTTG